MSEKTERWRAIDRVFAEALDLEPKARPAFLDRACAGDTELRAAVDRLLAAAEDDPQLRTIKETIEEAFRELLRAQARREEVVALATMDGLDLADPEVMAGAWRA